MIVHRDTAGAHPFEPATYFSVESGGDFMSEAVRKQGAFGNFADRRYFHGLAS